MKYICFLVISTVIFPFNLLFAEMETEEDTLTRLSDTFFKLFEKGQVDRIPKLFHFPSSSSPDSVAKDTKFIVAGMRTFLREFGKIKSTQPASYQESCLDFRIGAGTPDYWANHPNYERRIYKISFSKVGDGYILFEFCKIEVEWQIGFMRFALPVSNAKAETTLSDIGKLLWQLKEVLSSKPNIEM